MQETQAILVIRDLLLVPQVRALAVQLLRLMQDLVARPVQVL